MQESERSDSLDDEQLMARVAARDEAAFTLLYDRYARIVYAMAVHVVGAGEAEEILQDVFLQLWNKATQFDTERGSFAAWFMTMVRNRMRDALRKRSYRERMTVADEIERVLTEIADPSVSVEETVWRNERADLLRRALRELPDEQRRVVILAYFGGMSQSTIAEQQNLPLGTVKKRIRLGLRKLHAFLTQPLVATSTDNENDL